MSTLPEHDDDDGGLQVAVEANKHDDVAGRLKIFFKCIQTDNFQNRERRSNPSWTHCNRKV